GRGKRERASLPLYADDEAWEIGLEADRTDALVSVFRSGPRPRVAVHERRVPLHSLMQAVLAALDGASVQHAPKGALAPLQALRHEFGAEGPSYGSAPAERVERLVAGRAAGGLVFSARAAFRRGSVKDGASRVRGESEIERADLHALLARG